MQHNYLKEHRESNGLKQTDVVDEIKKRADTRFNVPLLSNMEHGLCLPTRAQLKVMCFLYGALPGQMYESGELSLISCLKSNEAKNINPIYHFKVDLPEKYRQMINPTVLKMNGFESREDWIIYCFEQLNSRNEKSPTQIA